MRVGSNLLTSIFFAEKLDNKSGDDSVKSDTRNFNQNQSLKLTLKWNSFWCQKLKIIWRGGIREPLELQSYLEMTNFLTTTSYSIIFGSRLPFQFWAEKKEIPILR